MQSSAFRPVLLPTALPWAQHDDPDLAASLCGPAGGEDGDDRAGAARARLADLDAHLHCSVVGTCLSTGELRKLMSRFMDLRGASDLDVHHEAVRLTSLQPEVARALHKALDRRHAAALQRWARAKDEASLAALWDESLRSGEVPGAYWAVLTHRRTTPDLRQRVFGDVHMLSHLVGAANRADIRRLVALERENDELRDRLDRLQERNLELVAERDRLQAGHDQALQRAARLQCEADAVAHAPRTDEAGNAALAQAVAVQAHRREAAESVAEACRDESRQLVQEVERLRAHAAELARELAAAESQLQDDGTAEGDGARSLAGALAGKRLLYVGGRPSSAPAIRAIAARAGADFRRHDGGLEDRKGLLGPALAWSDLVVFPVDCIDHDSALALKRDCVRQGKPFIALRSASAASFLAAIASKGDAAAPGAAAPGICLRHG